MNIIENAAATQAGNIAAYSQSKNAKSTAQKSDERETAVADVRLSEDAKAANEQAATAADGLAFANRLKQSLEMPNAHFATGLVKGIGPGNIPGVKDKINFILDPQYCAKLAGDPEEQERFADSVSFLYNAGTQFVKSLKASGRKVISQGFFCDKDGNWGGWTVTGPSSKSKSLTQEISKKIKEIKKSAQERRAELAALAEKRAERQEEREELRTAQSEKSPDDYLTPMEKELKGRFGDRFLWYREMQVAAENGTPNPQHLKALGEAIKAYREMIVPTPAAMDGSLPRLDAATLQETNEKARKILDAYVDQLERAGVDFSRAPMVDAYRKQRAAENKIGGMKSASRDDIAAVLNDPALAQAGNSLAVNYGAAITSAAEGRIAARGGAARTADSVAIYLGVYADMYDEIVRGHQDGTRNRYARDENSPTGYRPLTLEEELAELDRGFASATKLFDIVSPLYQEAAGNADGKAESAMAKIAAAWKEAYNSSGSKKNALASVRPLIDELFPDLREEAAEKSAAEKKAEQSGESESGKTTVTFNAAKRARQLAAAKTQAQVKSVISLLEQDKSECQNGVTNGWCDESEVKKVEAMLRAALEKLGQVKNEAASPADEAAFAVAGLM